jgi:glycosyltransferase involved in cell wall biosynthesis
MVAPKYRDMPKTTPGQIHDFYGVKSNFKITRLPSLLHLSKPLVDGKKHRQIPLVGGLSVLVSTWVFALKLVLTRRLKNQTIIYSRNVNGAYVFFKLKHWLLRRKNIKIYFEVHSLDQQHPRKFFHKLLRESDGLICITKALKDALIQNYHISADKIFIAPDGVRTSQLTARPLSKAEARAQLNIRARHVVLYTGQLLPGKGADVFVDAAKYFANDVTFFLVGGHGDYWEQMQRRVKEEKLMNIVMTGFVPPAQVPIYQSAADVLVLPATSDHAISAYTSPLKLFEYMASRRPIVASDLPVLQEILTDGRNALFFRERDAADLAEKISSLLQDEQLVSQLAACAREDVHDYTWENRAGRILEFIKGGVV